MKDWWPAIVYTAVALICWYFGGAPRRGVERKMWVAVSASLPLLGLLRSYGVQSRITDSWRQAARQHGWYDDRGVYQLDLIVAGGIFVAAVALCLGFLLRAVDGTTRAAISGACLLGLASLLYVISAHGLDALLGMAFLGVRVRWAVDALGIVFLVGAAAAFRLNRSGGRVEHKFRPRDKTRMR